MDPFWKVLGIIFQCVRVHLRDDLSKTLWEPSRGSGGKWPQPVWITWNAKSMFLSIQVSSSLSFYLSIYLLTFQSVALIKSESQTEDGYLGAPGEGTSGKKTKLWPEGGQKGSQKPDLGTLFGVILVSCVGIVPTLVFASCFICFGGFVGALLGAFVGFGSPVGDHFAFIFRSLNDVFPNQIFALIVVIHFRRLWAPLLDFLRDNFREVCSKAIFEPRGGGGPVVNCPRKSWITPWAKSMFLPIQ